MNTYEVTDGFLENHTDALVMLYITLLVGRSAHQNMSPKSRNSMVFDT